MPKHKRNFKKGYSNVHKITSEQAISSYIEGKGIMVSIQCTIRLTGKDAMLWTMATEGFDNANKAGFHKACLMLGAGLLNKRALLMADIAAAVHNDVIRKRCQSKEAKRK